jgi:hypothetical protein
VPASREKRATSSWSTVSAPFGCGSMRNLLAGLLWRDLRLLKRAPAHAPKPFSRKPAAPGRDTPGAAQGRVALAAKLKEDVRNP